MLLKVVFGSLVFVSLSAMAHDTSGGRNSQCSGVIPGAKATYLFSKGRDRIVVRTSYSEAPAFGNSNAPGQSVVSAKVNIQVFPSNQQSANVVDVSLFNDLSGDDCSGRSGSVSRSYKVQLKPCKAGNLNGFEGTLGGSARLQGRPDGFPLDSQEAMSIGYLSYCKNGPALGLSSQRMIVEINRKPLENPVGDKGAFGLKF